jgi:spermidine/putrescine-binding protein
MQLHVPLKAILTMKTLTTSLRSLSMRSVALRSLGLLALGLLGLAAAAPEAQAQLTAVSKSQREIIILQAEMGDDFFYNFLEQQGVAMAVSKFTPVYNRVRVLSGANATLTGLKNELAAATSIGSVKAVDLLFMTHGDDEYMKFTNAWRSTAEVRDFLKNNISVAQRAKFRMVFSTACFSGSHRNQWLQAGFKCASGSVGIYADSNGSFDPFLNSWSSGKNFIQTVSDANFWGLVGGGDAAARAFYTATFQFNYADAVNSHRMALFASIPAQSLSIANMTL